MPDTTTVSSAERAEIRLATIADPRYCEGLLAALDCLAAQDALCSDRMTEPMGHLLRGAAA